MESLVLPTLTDGTAFYSLRTTLDGVDYLLELRWATRESRWYLSLYDTEGNLLIGSQKILTNWPMLRYYHHRAIPPGELVASTLSADQSPPGFYDLGEGARCQLCYFPPVIAADAANVTLSMS